MKIPAKPWIVVAGLCLAGVIGAVDYLSGYQISFAIFYLVPILLVAWYVNRPAGIAACLAGTVIWAVADHLSGHRYDSIIILFWNAGVRLGFFVIIVLSISRIKVALDKEQTSSRMDFLTGVANRKGMIERMEQEIDRADRYPAEISLAYIDLDNFKAVNDGEGHDVGDELLSRVGRVIRSNIRGPDLCARMGGDEFAVLLPETGQEAALEVMSRLQERLQAAMDEAGWGVSFSIGLVTFPRAPESAYLAIKEADRLMYRAKAEGKGRLMAQSSGPS